MKYTSNTFSLCCGALLTALICILTMVIQIPIPLGYAHLGDAAILLGATYFGRREAVWASGLGSCLADLLTGFTQWVIPTFFIKVIIALIASGFCSIKTAVSGSFTGGVFSPQASAWHGWPQATPPWAAFSMEVSLQDLLPHRD